MPSEAQFRQAIAVAVDDQEFVGFPVDWWDPGASRWRPSFIEGLGALTYGERSNAQIACPIREHEEAENIADLPLRVSLSYLRPSLLIDDQLASFYSSRYVLTVLDKLLPAFVSEAAQYSDFESALATCLTSYGRGYENWRDQFEEGAADSEVRDYVIGQVAETIELRGVSQDKISFFSAIAIEKAGGAVHVAPVACWDETARIWRPTLVIGAGHDEQQFEASAQVVTLVPGQTPDTKTVSGALLSPLQIEDLAWQMLAIPIVAVDMVRFSDGMQRMSATQDEVASHPSYQSMRSLLTDVTAAWRQRWLAGIVAEPPDTQVIQLDPSVWTFSETPAGVVDEDR